jgi:hypothetical protein
MRSMTGLTIVLLLITGGCATLRSETLSAPRTIDFESCDVGRAPAGFTTALTGGGGPTAWIVREDSSAPSGSRVLVQESSDETSYRFPLCICDGVNASDVFIEVRFKALSGSVDEAAGIVLRYRPENYLIARANALEDNVNIYKTVNGKRTIISEAEMKVTAHEWHTLGFAAKGAHLLVTFDGKVVIEADDASIAGPGKVGLWTKADSVTAFVDFHIEPR